MSRLHGEAVTLLAEVRAELGRGRKGLNKACEGTVSRLRVLIDEANSIANGENLSDRRDSEAAGDVGGQAAIDALFGTR
ncbi:MAG: hypothetical protein ACREDO_12280 [Methyloceanibacter sp.]